ncbi:MAG: class I SAM-dependent methyltransferase [Bacteriovoracaceae bacterium]|nr:class I SAM-dependent methyltransferase [Bacteriovoracaceae bacterium]
MEDKTTIQNRLLKNFKKLKKWINQNNIEAYRLYDKDIPQYPYIIDIYKDSAIVWEKGKKLEPTEENQSKVEQHRSDIIQAIQQSMGIERSNIYLKVRQVQKGKNQYETITSQDQTMVVTENGCKYKVNLTDYLDSGLFLDHRPMRETFREISRNKSVLNLFCYTGSFSIASALGKGQVTSVDMSKTYLNWAKDNFRLNNLTIGSHRFFHSDTFEFLKSDDETYDLIFCDPPSFSNSKRMEGSFDVQRDHTGLVRLCMARLNKGGELYFSNNFRKFKIDEELLREFEIKDISLKTIPRDFTDLKIHHCFKITAKN